MALHGGKLTSNFGPIREQLDFFYHPYQGVTFTSKKDWPVVYKSQASAKSTHKTPKFWAE